MILKQFNGGLNVRQAPELIAANEAVVCTNVSTESDQLSSCKGLGASTLTGAKPFYFEAEDTWFPDADTRDYLEYQDVLYWTDGNIAKKYSNSVTQNLGILAPAGITAVLSATATPDGVGIVQYVYTYYNDVDGTESAPSPISAEVDITTFAADITVTASPDPQTTHIFLYRLGGSFLSFTRIEELSNTTTVHTDLIADADSLNLVLDSNLNGVPPTGLKYLSQAYGVFFGAVGPKLYFTRDVGNPNYWPATNYIDFRQDITGIAIIANGTIVTTKYQTYLISGTNSQTFVKYLISSDQGCISHKSIALLGGAALFVSTDGICSVQGTTVQVVSKFKLGKIELNPINAVVHDEAYYCQLQNGDILSFDTRYTPSLKYYNFSTDWLVVAQDILYGVKATVSYLMFAGTLVEYTYKTGNLTDGSSSELKGYNDVYLSISGTHEVKVYIDNALVLTREIKDSPKPVVINVPQVNQRGSRIAFECKGTGTIREIEYKAAGRTNGR